LNVRFDPSRGKGSHGLLYVGKRRTVVKRGELKRGTVRGMLKQLDIREEDF
jgi:predicted RNA binding protein YcfA (HicA-like mRNA interferase family)